MKTFLSVGGMIYGVPRGLQPLDDERGDLDVIFDQQNQHRHSPEKFSRPYLSYHTGSLFSTVIVRADVRLISFFGLVIAVGQKRA